MNRTSRAVVWVLPLALAGGGASASSDGERVVARTRRISGGVTYTFEKVRDAAGAVAERVLRDGVPVDAVPVTGAPLAEAALEARLAAAGDGEMIAVNIALAVGDDAAGVEGPETSAIAFAEGRPLSRVQDGREVSEEEMAEMGRVRQDRLRVQRLARVQAQQQELAAFAARQGLEGRPEVEAALAGEAATLAIALPAARLRRLLAQPDPAVAGIELAYPVADQIAGAMLATNVTHYAPASRGSGIGIYMTESGCADETGRSNYDRLAGSQTDHSQNVFGILRAVAGNAYIYCRGGAVLPVSGDLDGVGTGPAIRVINRSNGGNDSTSYSTLDRDWDNFAYKNRLPIFNAAGNSGTGTGNIISPAKGLSVVAVGNYNDASSAINSSSSFVDTELGSSKPELSAPGTSITAGGFTMTGTSMASPHAAAFAADMMSGWSFYRDRPEAVYATMIAGATDAITGGLDKVGAGGIDFLSTYYNGWAFSYIGGNGDYESFDAWDGADDGGIEQVVYIDAGEKVRVAIAWMNRGTFTYAHRTDAHPIGQDVDLVVYGPNGSFMGGSWSYDNPFETVDFTAPVSGNYRMRMTRYANRDTSANFHLGLTINLKE
jgi:hypothetical protein